jgi:hypothetical protein
MFHALWYARSTKSLVTIRLYFAPLHWRQGLKPAILLRFIGMTEVMP